MSKKNCFLEWVFQWLREFLHSRAQNIDKKSKEVEIVFDWIPKQL